MGQPSHGNYLPRSEGGVQGGSLPRHPHQSTPNPARGRGQVKFPHFYLPPVGDGAPQGLQQGALSAAVGAQDEGQPSGGEDPGNPEYRPAAVGGREILASRRSLPRPLSRTRIQQNRAPGQEVITLLELAQLPCRPSAPVMRAPAEE